MWCLPLLLLLRGENDGPDEIPTGLTIEARLTLDEPLQDPPPMATFEGPHDSVTRFFELHFSSRAWKEYVWDDYLTRPAVLIPLSLGATAAIVSHWDKPWERKLRGFMGGNATIGNVTLYT